MKVGITGAGGLLGFHVRARLHSAGGGVAVRLADRDTFRDAASLDRFVVGLDALIHCAGMNRGDESEVEQTNRRLAADLVDAFRRTAARPIVVYANSTHVDRDTGYGRGKRAAGEAFEAWGAEAAVPVANVVLPHVFGEFGRPFYNSVVSTFCHQLATGAEPVVEVDGLLELVHAQDVAQLLIDGARGAKPGRIRMEGRKMTVRDMLGRVRTMLERYRTHVVPDLGDAIDLRLFNTLRSYLYTDFYPRPLVLHSDARGSLFEAVKSDQGGQAFMSTTLPGVTRGNHFHLRKVERFLVVGGEAVISLRKLFSDEVRRFRVSGTEPAYIDMPTFFTHAITNVGTSPLQTLFWASEIFDPQDPDTFAEVVAP